MQQTLSQGVFLGIQMTVGICNNHYAATASFASAAFASASAAS